MNFFKIHSHIVYPRTRSLHFLTNTSSIFLTFPMSSNPKSPYFVILKMATEYRAGHREALLLRLQGPAIASALQKNKQRSR
jgi:hypothetical protein